MTERWFVNIALSSPNILEYRDCRRDFPKIRNTRLLQGHIKQIRMTPGRQSILNAFEDSRLIMALVVWNIMQFHIRSCRKTGKEISLPSRAAFLEQILPNKSAL